MFLQLSAGEGWKDCKVVGPYFRCNLHNFNSDFMISVLHSNLAYNLLPCKCACKQEPDTGAKDNPEDPEYTATAEELRQADTAREAEDREAMTAGNDVKTNSIAVAPCIMCYVLSPLHFELRLPDLMNSANMDKG
jgi:hypothetical protein